MNVREGRLREEKGESVPDQWARWLLERRHGGDPERHKAVLEQLYPVRDRVLANARVTEGDTVLDVGCGDGLVGFGALARVGEHGRVIFSDISQDLLEHCRSLARQMGVLDRCRFARARAEDLSPIADASVDVVTTRSVLIYVAAKARAFREFYRVLRPGGRLSIFEPINRFGFPEPEHLFWGYDVSPVLGIAARVRAVYRGAQPLDADPMLDFDERDLMAFAEEAGFVEIHLELRADIAPVARGCKWETFLRTAPNPKAPTLAEAMDEALTPEEARRFAAHLRPLVERGQATRRSAVAYLWAMKEGR